MRIFKNAWFIRFARHQKIPDSALIESVRNAENGLVDANLGSGLIKQRISLIGQGKSRGFRAIILYHAGEKAFFVYGFAKSSRANIRKDEEAQFKKMAKYVLRLSDPQLDDLIFNGKLEEISNVVEKIPK